MVADRPGNRAGEADGRRGRDQADVPHVGRAASVRGAARRLELVHVLRHSLFFGPQFFLQGLGEGLLVLAPGGHADELDVLLDELGRGLVGVPLVDGADDSHRGELHARGQGPGLGAIDDAPVHVLEPFVRVPDVIPNAGLVGDDVGRFAALEDDVVEPLRQGQMLPQVVRGHVHDLDGVEGAPPDPGRAGRVGRLALEGEDRREEGVAADAVVGAEAARAVVVDDGVDALEEARPDHVRPAGDDLLGRRAEDLDRPFDAVCVHGLLDGDGRGRRGRAHGVMAAAVAGRALDDRVLCRHAGFLREHGQGVELAEKPDDRLPGAVTGDEAGRHAGQAALDRESGGLERVGQELRRPELLEAELGVFPDGVGDPAEYFDGLGTAEPVEGELFLLGDLGLRRRPGRGAGDEGKDEQKRKRERDDPVSHGISFKKGSNLNSYNIPG